MTFSEKMSVLQVLHTWSRERCLTPIFIGRQRERFPLLRSQDKSLVGFIPGWAPTDASVTSKGYERQNQKDSCGTALTYFYPG